MIFVDLTENKSEQGIDSVQLAQPPHGAERTFFTSARKGKTFEQTVNYL